MYYSKTMVYSDITLYYRSSVIRNNARNGMVYFLWLKTSTM